MAAADYGFTEDELVIDESVGYPKAYAKLCRDRSVCPYNHGPPFTFTPYALQQYEAFRAGDLDKMFPILDPKAKPTAKPKMFVSLMWKQLNHLGNAGFDPAVIRVDPYGNVLYYHADSASPLAWDIDHWFPCSRGGLTVPSNLRILQWQVCKKKHNKLEFLIPWWEFQLGISVNQFLSIFASSNSDFRHRAFSFFFPEGENEELNSSQTVDSHSFLQHFVESKEQLGLAPAAIVATRRESYGSSSVLRSLDYNRHPRSRSPIIAARKVKPSSLKENENPDFLANPYQAIVVARDSLKQREEAAKMHADIQNLDDEVNEISQKNEEEKVNIQDLELQLIKRRRRAEKCRRLAEAQSSYRTMLEKMIRDAMHQSVIYKEQVRLNQAATNALMARLEAQKAICDTSEKELHKKYNLRDELEKQIRPEWEVRKRSRIGDTLVEERDHKSLLYLPGIKPKTPLHKELRAFLEEEQKASEAGLSLSEEEKQAEADNELNKCAKDLALVNYGEHERSINELEGANLIEHKLGTLEIGDKGKHRTQFPVSQEPEIEEDEESRKQRGKGNVEKWLQMLLETTTTQEELESPNDIENETNRSDDMIRKLNIKYPQKEVRNSKFVESEDKEGMMKHIFEKQQQTIRYENGGTEAGKPQPERINIHEGTYDGVESGKSFEGRERSNQNGKERKLVRSESARAFHRIPSSPSLILGMKKGVDCIRKKPMVYGDDEVDEEYVAGNSFIKSSRKTIKKALKI
ncbi:uncharacterized protein LOC107409301 [Ziziphus jujuba]|uniref:Uncharacterized protein LOC107409301 n=1 Tax=Ziziphus jujuba TaxID=326968 RepID=A0A6P3Z437_ZIZJJ|nr:uncharacterized protein LOC107409301 [Ziziphus jujuba]